MFNQGPFSSQGMIFLFLSLRQSMIFRLLERGLAVFMKFCQALVACVRQNAEVFSKIVAMIFEQLKIVFASTTERCGDNPGTLSFDPQLPTLLRVTLLFATVVSFLAFFGRSIGCSLTSTRMASNTVLLAWSAFLPGNRNFPKRTSTFSTI
jgi:hypothetical protein